MTAPLSRLITQAAMELARGLFLHTDAVTQKFNILGQSGGGKTYTAMKLAELILGAHGRIFVFDLVGVWNGLLSSADGLRPGFPLVVIGGERGHLPLNAKAGRLVADLAFDRDVSVVVDLSQLFVEDEAAVHAFVTDCLHQLFKRHQQVKKRRHVIFEEAQELFPEGGATKEQYRLLRVGKTFCKIGRNYGLGYTTISQEPQSVSKRILNQAGTIIAVRTIGELERDAIVGTVRSKPLDLMNVLPTLETGEAIVHSPAWLKFSGRVRILRKETFDSSRTPDGDEDVVEPKVLAMPELEQLRDAMASQIAEAEKNDPAVLQREIARLRAELGKKPAAAPAPATREIVPILGPAAVAQMKALEQTFAQLGPAIRRTAEEFEPKVRAMLEVFAAARRDYPTDAGNAMPVPPPQPPSHAGGWSVAKPSKSPVPRLPAASAPMAEGEEKKLAAGPLKMLEALASKHPGPVSRKQLAALSGFSIKGGSFRTYLPRLRVLGLVDYRGDDVVLTDAGADRVAAAIASGPRTTEELLTQWRAKLASGPRKMFDEVVSVYPGMLTRAELAERTNFELGGGSFRTYLPRLRTLGLVEYVGGDQVRASDTLFPS